MLPTFYINLDKRCDRKVDLEHQLANLNLEATRISAIDGNQLTQKDIQFVNQKHFFLKMKRPITNGEIGCAMSHRKVWQKMLDDDIHYALVLEDDVVIDPIVLTLFENASVYKTFDFLNLSSNTPYNLNLTDLKLMIKEGYSVRNVASEQRFKELDWNKSWKIYTLVDLENNILCECNTAPALGSGYILSLQAAKQFLIASDTLDVPIDYIWRYSSGMLKQGFLAQPLIIQKDNDSNISGRNITHNLSFKQKIARLMLKQKSNPRKKDVKRMYL